MSYVVAHLQKFKSVDVRGLEIHINRESKNNKNKDIENERTKYNVNLLSPDEAPGEFKFRAKVKEKVEQRTNNETKLRKDAVCVCSVVVSASTEFFEGKTREQIDNYFQDAADCLSSLFGTQNTVGAYIHYDEQTPHMHFLFVPRTRNNELCAKKVITRNSLRKLQDELPKYLQQRGYDVQRGIKDSPRYHIKTEAWKRDELLKEELQEELLYALRTDDLATVRAAADKVVGLIENNSEIVRKRHELDKLAEEMQQQKSDIVAAMREQQARSDELIKRAQKLDGREQMLQMYKASLEAQDKNVALQRLAEDLEHQEMQLREKQRQFDKDIIERVYSIVRKTVAEEIEREGEQGRFAIAAMKVLKEKDPSRWKEVINIAGKTLDVTRKVVKEINQEKLLPPK